MSDADSMMSGEKKETTDEFELYRIKKRLLGTKDYVLFFVACVWAVVLLFIWLSRL